MDFLLQIASQFVNIPVQDYAIAFGVVSVASVLDEELPPATDKSWKVYAFVRGIVHVLDNPTVLRFLKLKLPASAPAVPAQPSETHHA